MRLNRVSPLLAAAFAYTILRQSAYTHIYENEYKRGANTKLPKNFMPCMCKWDGQKPGCGEGSGCVNRELMMECNVDDCPIGENCQNRRFGPRGFSRSSPRFQVLDYAPIEVFRADKKGFGVKALSDLYENQFIIEYCGEVIPQSTFVKRTREYSENGTKHFYFMSLRNDELIDATKKGNMSRFLNHSCAPNCILQKWVVQNRVRMGIFTLRKIAAGEELTFDYKFERYGEKAQNCYCGESVCQGYIGRSKSSDNLGFDLDDGEDVNAVESEVWILLSLTLFSIGGRYGTFLGGRSPETGQVCFVQHGKA